LRNSRLTILPTAFFGSVEMFRKGTRFYDAHDSETVPSEQFPNLGICVVIKALAGYFQVL
jgi:hypothetical protein